MTTTALEDIVSPLDSYRDALTATATRLYDAEVALHIARQTGVDAWVAAAYDRLHLAVCQHQAALATAARTFAPRDPARGLTGARRAS